MHPDRIKDRYAMLKNGIDVLYKMVILLVFVAALILAWFLLLEVPKTTSIGSAFLFANAKQSLLAAFGFFVLSGYIVTYSVIQVKLGARAYTRRRLVWLLLTSFAHYIPFILLFGEFSSYDVFAPLAIGMLGISLSEWLWYSFCLDRS